MIYDSLDVPTYVLSSELNSLNLALNCSTLWSLGSWLNLPLSLTWLESYPTENRQVYFILSLKFILQIDFSETLTAAEFEKTMMTIQGKSGELHPLADYGDVASAKGFNQSDLQTFCNILYSTYCTSINAP